jgi:hypothetical protein
VVTKKAAATTAQDDAATFDVAAWLEDLQHQGLKPRNVVVRLHFRADLLPEIQQTLDELSKVEESPNETGVDDDDPAVALLQRYNDLVAEFEAGGSLPFEFRPMNTRIQNSTFAEWQERYPDDKERRWLLLMRMAASCVSHPGITPEAFDAFEEHYGSAVFATLMTGFVEAYNAGGEPTAPFLPKPLPTRDTGGSSTN